MPKPAKISAPLASEASSPRRSRRRLMPAAAPDSPSPGATEGVGIPWFIFTAGGRGYCLEADNVSKAVAKWRKLNAKAAPADIVAVIRGAHGEITGPIITTPIYGVVVCMQYKSPSA